MWNWSIKLFRISTVFNKLITGCQSLFLQTPCLDARQPCKANLKPRCPAVLIRMRKYMFQARKICTCFRFRFTVTQWQCSKWEHLKLYTIFENHRRCSTWKFRNFQKLVFAKLYLTDSLWEFFHHWTSKKWTKINN